MCLVLYLHSLLCEARTIVVIKNDVQDIHMKNVIIQTKSLRGWNSQNFKICTHFFLKYWFHHTIFIMMKAINIRIEVTQIHWQLVKCRLNLYLLLTEKPTSAFGAQIAKVTKLGIHSVCYGKQVNGADDGNWILRRWHPSFQRWVFNF